MSDGWIPAWRKLFEPGHPIGMGEPVCPRFAWLDVCQGAPRESRRRHLGRSGVTFVQEAGTVLLAQRKLAQRWRWSRHRVRQFIDFLVDEERCLEVIGPPPGADPKRSEGTLYRIVRYDDYALDLGVKRHSRGPHSGPDGGPTGPTSEGAQHTRTRPQNPPSEPTTESALRNQRAGDPANIEENTGRSEGGDGVDNARSRPQNPPSEPTSKLAQEQEEHTYIHTGAEFSTDLEAGPEERLAAYLGEGAPKTLARMRSVCTAQQYREWVGLLEVNHLPFGKDSRVWRRLREDIRAEVLDRALGEFAIKHPPRENPAPGGGMNYRHFRGFLGTCIAQELKPVTADGLTAEQEERKLQQLRQQAADRATSRPVRARDGDPLMGHTEDELRAWYRGLDQEAQSEILRTKDRLLSVMAQGSVPLTPTARERCELQAIVGAYRQSAAARESGPQTVGEILGKGAA